MTESAAREVRFRRETLAHGFRYRCAYCTHAVHGDGRCSLGYPNHMMRTPDLRCRDDGGRWIFCKYFELDGT